MAVNVGSLLVNLKADTAQFVTGMNHANKRLDSFAKTASNAGKILAGFISIYAIKRVADFGKGAIEAADQIGKMSRAVGFSAETFQELSFASERSGVNTAQLTSNMTAFVKRVGEARANTGPLVSFLQKYDTTLLDSIAHTKTQEEAFNLMSEAIKNASTDTDKAALANAAFSRAGVTMVNVMRDGVEGLDNLRAQARATGGVLSNETIAKAEDAADKMTNMSYAVTGLANSLAVQYGSAVIDFAQKTALNIPKAINSAKISFNAFEIAIQKTKLALYELIQAQIEFYSSLPFGETLIDKVYGQDFRRNVLGNIRDASLEISRLAEEQDNLFNTKFDDSDLVKLGKAYEEIAARRVKAATGGTSAGAPTVDKKATEAYFDSLKSQEEKTAEAYQRRAEIIANAQNEGLISQQKAHDLMLYEEARYLNDLASIRQAGLTAIERFTQKSYGQQAATIFGELENITRGVAQKNRTLFEINKVAQIANAIVNAHAGASRTLAHYPWPIGPALAALHYAAGIAQVSAIQSASFGTGAAGGVAVSGGGAVPTFEANPTTGLPQGGGAPSQGTTTIHVYARPGDVFTADQVDALIDQIREATDRGDKIILDKNSRNGLELRGAA